MEMTHPEYVWKAFDGTLFEKKEECVKYEENNKTEQRRYARLIVFELNINTFYGNSKFIDKVFFITDRTVEEVMTYVIQFFGDCFEQKVSGKYVRKWSLVPSTLSWNEAIEKAIENDKKHLNIGDAPTLLFVSRDYLKGFPDPVYPNFRKV